MTNPESATMTNDEILERLSAFADGAEASARERDRLIEGLAADEVLRGRWRRYHVIGDVLRGEGVLSNVAAGVHDAVAAEPTLLAPRRMTERPLPRWLAPAAGLAAAASFGAMAVLLLPRAELGSGAGTPAVSSALRQPQLEIVRADPLPGASHLPVADRAVGDELQRYLTVHSDVAATGLKGPLPLAPLLVGYGTER
jgi:sigma-E factor negative regulatory protein RseA